MTKLHGNQQETANRTPRTKPALKPASETLRTPKKVQRRRQDGFRWTEDRDLSTGTLIWNGVERATKVEITIQQDSTTKNKNVIKHYLARYSCTGDPEFDSLSYRFQALTFDAAQQMAVIALNNLRRMRADSLLSALSNVTKRSTESLLLEAAQDLVRKLRNDGSILRKQ